MSLSSVQLFFMSVSGEKKTATSNTACQTNWSKERHKLLKNVSLFYFISTFFEKLWFIFLSLNTCFLEKEAALGTGRPIISKIKNTHHALSTNVNKWGTARTCSFVRNSSWICFSFCSEKSQMHTQAVVWRDPKLPAEGTCTSYRRVHERICLRSLWQQHSGGAARTLHRKNKNKPCEGRCLRGGPTVNNGNSLPMEFDNLIWLMAPCDGWDERLRELEIQRQPRACWFRYSMITDVIERQWGTVYVKCPPPPLLQRPHKLKGTYNDLSFVAILPPTAVVLCFFECQYYYYCHYENQSDNGYTTVLSLSSLFSSLLPPPHFSPLTPSRHPQSGSSC